MRIAVDCSHRIVGGGVRSYLDNLLWALAVVEPDNEYVLYSRGRRRPRVSPEMPEGAHTSLAHARAPQRLLASSENLLGWPRVETWTGGIDVIHGTHFTLPPASKSTRKILTVHDVAYLRHPEFYGNKRLNDYGYRYLLPHSLKRADAVITGCYHAKEDIVDATGYDADRIWVVPHGVDPRFEPAGLHEVEVLRDELGLLGDYIVYAVGTHEPRKNLESAIRAFTMAFPDDGPDLLLTGAAHLSPRFRQLASELRVVSRIRCAEVGYPDELRAIYTGARFGIYPSLYEGFGFPPLEAMACGLPMIVSNRTACPEVVGDAALKIDPLDIGSIADAMKKLYEDDALHEDLAYRGVERTSRESFEWRRSARQTLAVYRDDRAAFEAETDPLTEGALELNG